MSAPPSHPGEKLSAYLDDELSPAERTSVDQHLQDCASCVQLLEELAAVDAASRALTVQVPEGYFDTLPARVRERLAARRARRIPAWTWAAAAAVLLAVLTPLTLRDRRSAPASVPDAAKAKPAQEESSFRRAAAPPPVALATAAPAMTPPMTLAAPATDKIGGLGYAADGPAAMEAKQRETRQKRDAALDARLGERDADAAASGADAGAVGGRADRKDGELKKETLGDQVAGGKLNQNAAPAAAPPPARPSATVPAAPPPHAAAEQEAQGAVVAGAPAGMEETMKGQRAEPAEAPRAQGYAAKPSPAEGALRATKAAAAPAPTINADEAVFAQEFEALASRPVSTAEDARTAARQWSELARRHPQAPSADEAHVRAIEAWATAFRLEHKDADLEQARKEAQAYMARKAPQKARVRAVLDQLAR